MMRQILIGCLLCCGLGVLTAAVPAPPAPANNADTDVAAEEPDLLQMLDFFKGKSEIPLLVTFLKQADLLKATVKGLFDISPMFQQVFHDAGRTNVGISILYKAVTGQMPDIRDMYNLATKGVGNMQTAYNEARKKNKKFQSIVNILRSKSSRILSSPSALHNLLYSLTGKNIMIDPELLKEVNSGTVKVNVNNLAQVNLIEIISYWKKNYNTFYNYVEESLTPPLNSRNLLSIFHGLDTSNLAMIKSMNGGMNNDKYTVVQGAGDKEPFTTDPLVVEILGRRQQSLAMQKGKSIDQVSAESLFMKSLVDFLNLTTKILKATMVERKV